MTPKPALISPSTVDHVADELVVDRAEPDRERLPVEQHRLEEVTDESRTRAESVCLDQRDVPETIRATPNGPGPTRLLDLLLAFKRKRAP